MSDREKVAKDLTDIGSWIAGRVGFEQAKNFLHTIDDAVALIKEQENLGTELTNAVELIHKKNERIEKLLKEQEAVEPVTESSVYDPDTWFFVCGSCKKGVISPGDKFCPWCGKRIDWKGWWKKNGTRNQDS